MPRRYVRKKPKWQSKVKRRRGKTLHFRGHFTKTGMFISSLALLLFLGLLGYGKIQTKLQADPKCNLTKIEITGLNYLSQQEVLNLTRIPAGSNIFSLRLKDIEGKIAVNPLVKSVKVERKWPSELVINIEEKKLLARLKDNNQFYLVDSQGQVIKDNLSALTHLPVITGLTSSDTRLPELVLFLQKFRKLDKDIFTRIAGLIWSPETGLIAQLSDGPQLFWGEMDGEKLPEKLALLRLVTRDMQDKGITSQYIDLRFKNVVVKPKQI